MLSCFPVGDISYLVAMAFTIGSALWVLNGFFIWLPLAFPDSKFPGEEEGAGGITAFIGATIFEIGGVLLFLEAINADREQNFGWAFLADLHRDELSPGMDAATRIEASPPDGDNKIAWVWAPSWHDFSTHLIFDLGFLASLIMVVGCTIFYIPGILALPQLYQLIEDADVVDQAFWTPLVVGGVLFVVSGVLYVLETQEKWWKPAPKQLGWHIAMWTLVGAIGFLLSPLFGLFSESDNDWALWQSNFSSLWGSWAFLIGSTIQWYESVNKHHVIKK